MKRHGSLWLVFLLVAVGCSSGNKKTDAREKAVSSSGLYCDFVNGEKNRQVELELNIMMAKKCDVDKPYSLTDYRSSADVSGLVFCCKAKDVQPVKAASVRPAPANTTNKNQPESSSLKEDENIDFGSN